MPKVYFGLFGSFFAIFIAKIVFFDKKSRFIAKNRNFFNFDHLRGQNFFCVILSHKIVKNEKIANLCGEKLDNAKKVILANFWPIWVIFAIFIANFFNFDHLQVGVSRIVISCRIPDNRTGYRIFAGYRITGYQIFAGYRITGYPFLPDNRPDIRFLPDNCRIIAR
jgi:hypothetical protein